MDVIVHKDFPAILDKLALVKFFRPFLTETNPETELFNDYQKLNLMKTILSSLILVLLSSTILSAQVKYDKMTMVAGPKPCLTITLPDTDSKFAQSEWKDYMKPYGKVSSVKGSKETVVENIHVDAIGDGNLIKVYNLADESVAGTRFIIWIDIGEDYLTDQDSNYHIAEDFLLKFAHKVKVDLVALDLAEQQKILDKLQSDQEKLERNNEKLHKIIEDSKSIINEAEIGIPMNETNQNTMRADIEKQRDYVDKVREDPKALKTEQKKLAKLQNELDKLEREHNNFYKDIENNKDKIAKAEQDIIENLQEQESSRANIETQKTIVEAVQNKLNQLKEEQY